jgi:glucokinase
MALYGLIADVGGTNIRLAIVELETGVISQVKKYLCADYGNITAVIVDYLGTVDQMISQACLAVACPTDGDWISMTNNGWAFSRSEAQNALGLDQLWLINDYTAIAMAVPTLKDEQKIQVGGDRPRPNSPIAIYGPGTGLGVAHLAYDQGRYIPLPGEGGHADFAPTNALQGQILSYLQSEFGHVSAERLLSGPGLVNIYRALCYIRGEQAHSYAPADVTKAGQSGDCPICAEAMSVFCQVMGSFGGNLALNLGAFGGVYIAGGIITRFMEFFQVSEFRMFFEDKGRLRDFCKPVPVYVITEEQPGLQGAGAYLRQSLGYSIIE